MATIFAEKSSWDIFERFNVYFKGIIITIICNNLFYTDKSYFAPTLLHVRLTWLEF